MSDTKTEVQVRCLRHGLITLEPDAAQRQRELGAGWSCPRCGRGAELETETQKPWLAAERDE